MCSRWVAVVVVKRHRELDGIAGRYGYILDRITGSGHRRYRHPETGHVVHAPSSAGDHRAIRNFTADLRRANRGTATGTLGSLPSGPPPSDSRPLPSAAAPPPSATTTQGETIVLTVAELTIGSLRAFADTLAQQGAVPRAATLRGSVLNVLAASSYLDADRLIDLDLDEIDNMLASARPHLSTHSRSTYISHLKSVAQMLIDQTATSNGDTPPVLARRSKPRARKPAPVTNPAPSAGTPQAGMLSIPFPLRTTFTVTLALPADLTAAEADRLAQMIKLLPVTTK